VPYRSLLNFSAYILHIYYHTLGEYPILGMVRPKFPQNCNATHAHTHARTHAGTHGLSFKKPLFLGPRNELQATFIVRDLDIDRGAILDRPFDHHRCHRVQNAFLENL
jgi:hypothetical protein